MNVTMKYGSLTNLNTTDIQSSSLENSPDKIKFVEGPTLFDQRRNSVKTGKKNRRNNRSLAIGTDEGPGVPKVTIKNHYVHEKGNIQSARANSGDPERSNRRLIRRKTLAKGEIIYRLPSLSKCLQNQIMPKSSMMLKQICEIATQNSGFIRTHFDEFIKNKALNLMHNSHVTSGPIPSKNDSTNVRLHIDGKEKQRSILFYQKGAKQHVPIGITNIELAIDSSANSHPSNQPVILPQAYFAQTGTTGSATNRLSPQSCSLIINQHKKLHRQSPNYALDNKRSGGQVKIHLPAESASSYTTNSPMVFGVNIERNRNCSNQGVLEPPFIPLTEIGKNTETAGIKLDDPEMQKLQEKQSPKSPQVAPLGESPTDKQSSGKNLNRKHVYSSNKPGKTSFSNGNRSSGHPSPAKSDGQSKSPKVQDLPKSPPLAPILQEDSSQPAGSHENPLLASGICLLNTESSKGQENIQTKLNRSTSSTSSIACLHGREVIPSFKQVMGYKRQSAAYRTAGIAKRRNRYTTETHEQEQTTAVPTYSSDRDIMSAIPVQNYPFRGILSKGSKRMIRKEGYGLRNFSQKDGAFLIDAGSPQTSSMNVAAAVLSQKQLIPRGNHTARNIGVRNSLQHQQQLMISASSLVPKDYNMYSSPQYYLGGVTAKRDQCEMTQTVESPTSNPLPPTPFLMPSSSSAESPTHRYLQPPAITTVHIETQHYQKQINDQLQMPNQEPIQQLKPFLYQENQQIQKPTSLTGRRMRLNEFEHKYAVRNPQHTINLYAISRKSVEVGGDDLALSNRHALATSRQPNTKDLAPVYRNEQVGTSEMLSKSIQKSLKHGPTSFYMFYDENGAKPPEKALDLMRQNSEMLGGSNHDPDRTRINEHIAAANYFGADVVGDDNQEIPVASQSTLLLVNNPPPSSANRVQSQRQIVHQSPMSQRQEPEQQVSLLTASQHPSGMSNANNTNKDLLMAPLLQAQKESSRRILSSQMATQSINKAKENFTIVLPQHNNGTAINSPASERKLGDDFYQTFQQQQQQHDKVHLTPFSKEDTIKLNRDESEELIVLRSRQNSRAALHQYTHDQQVRIPLNKITEVTLTTTKASPKNLISPAPEERVPIYSNNYPIKSVYDYEQEAKSHGFIKEMVFVAPANHEPSPQANVAKKKPSPVRQSKSKPPTQWHPVFQTVLSSGTDLHSIKPLSPTLHSGNTTQRHMEPFSESDDELASKLMKQVMPSNYRKKRRHERNQLISSTLDSTLRMPTNFARRSLGIKFLDPKELAKDKNILAKSQQVKEFARQRGGVADLNDMDHMQLIAYCLGTAPSKYKLDVPQISQQLLELLGIEKPKKIKEKVLTSDHNQINNHTNQPNSRESKNRENNPNNEEEKIMNEEKSQKHLHLTINESELKAAVAIPHTFKSQASNLEQNTEELPHSQSGCHEYMTTPTRCMLRSSFADSSGLQTTLIGPAKQQQFVVSGQTLPMGKNSDSKQKRKKMIVEKYKTCGRSGVIADPNSSNPQLVQNYNDLRHLGEKFLITPHSLREEPVGGAQTVGEKHLKDVLAAEIGIDMPSLKMNEGEAVLQDDLKNLGIKTTISITTTHHQAQHYITHNSQNNNKDILNVNMPFNDAEYFKEHKVESSMKSSSQLNK